MKEIKSKISEHIQTSEFKGIFHLIVVPLMLLYISSNAIAPLLFIVSLSLFYLFFKKNTENGRVFFEFMGIIAIVLSLALLMLLLVILIAIVENNYYF